MYNYLGHPDVKIRSEQHLAFYNNSFLIATDTLTPSILKFEGTIHYSRKIDFPKSFVFLNQFNENIFLYYREGIRRNLSIFNWSTNSIYPYTLPNNLTFFQKIDGYFIGGNFENDTGKIVSERYLINKKTNEILCYGRWSFSPIASNDQYIIGTIDHGTGLHDGGFLCISTQSGLTQWTLSIRELGQYLGQPGYIHKVYGLAGDVLVSCITGGEWNRQLLGVNVNTGQVLYCLDLVDFLMGEGWWTLDIEGKRLFGMNQNFAELDVATGQMRRFRKISHSYDTEPLRIGTVEIQPGCIYNGVFHEGYLYVAVATKRVNRSTGAPNAVGIFDIVKEEIIWVHEFTDLDYNLPTRGGLTGSLVVEGRRLYVRDTNNRLHVFERNT